jgi:uncharacterized protein YndB with AHSA1/START domain
MTDPELIENGSRPAVRVMREFDHPIERVWRAVTSPEHLARWFPSDVEIDLVPGSEIRFGSFEGASAHGQVLEVDPPHRLVFSWDTDRLEFDLKANDSGTTFALTHVFDDRAGAASFATGWEMCLTALADLLADQPPRPSSRGTDRHEELVIRFGLDRPQVTHSPAGWQVRFERQLVCPAEVAWNLFFGVDPVTGEQRLAPRVGEQFHPYAVPEVDLGTVTEVDPPRVFAFETAPDEPGDMVRLELTAGTGHGARLILDVSGRVASELEPAIDQWGDGAISAIARQAVRLAPENAPAA